MKANAVKAEKVDMSVPEKPCAVCGTMCKPFGYVRHGKAQVCSKDCDQQYHQARYTSEPTDQPHV